MLNVLLGEGNDHLTIAGTLVPAPDPSTGVVAVHGGITTVHGGGNAYVGGSTADRRRPDHRDRRPASPLVVYGDTSQDGAWYSGDPAQQSIRDFGTKPFPAELGNARRTSSSRSQALPLRRQRRDRRERADVGAASSPTAAPATTC